MKNRREKILMETASPKWGFGLIRAGECTAAGATLFTHFRQSRTSCSRLIWLAVLVLRKTKTEGWGSGRERLGLMDLRRKREPRLQKKFWEYAKGSWGM